MLEREQELIARAQAGDIECFAQLYDHYIPKIYRFVFVKTSHKQEAEDLTHEVFLSAWQNLGRYEHKGFPFSSWLYQVARNKIIDYYRVRKSHASVEEADADAEWAKVENTLAQDLDNSLRVEHIKKLFRILSPDQQDVILMRFVEDLSYGEIAHAMGKSEGAVRLIQHRAIQELRKQLGLTGEGDIEALNSL